MLTPLSVAVKIWAKTNAIVIIILVISAIFFGEGWAILVSVVVVFLGYLLTSPLLIVISPLVKWSSHIPYSNSSRMAWLIFFLFLLYLLVFIGLRMAVGDNYEGFMDKQEALFMLSIIVVQFIAVRTTRKSLYKFYEEFDSSHD